MFRMIPRRTAYLGLLLAVAGCTALQQPPIATGGSSTGPAAPAATTAPKVASLAIEPTNIELNAPYSYGSYQSETEVGLPDRDVAGYPTTAKLWPTFLDSEGKRIPTADVDWISSNPELVMVDQTGWLRSVDPGTSGTLVITARLKSDPTILATASVVLRNDGKLSLELK
ncbi:MAG TPA: hypothetical protein V6D05_17765 [Stenomitos sp.]